MRQIDYLTHYKDYFKDDFDRRPFYLHKLEPRICYYTTTLWVRNMSSDDVAQDLRMHLFQKLAQYNPDISSITTWGNRVIKNKIHDWRNPQKYRRDKLDANGRVVLPL